MPAEVVRAPNTPCSRDSPGEPDIAGGLFSTDWKLVRGAGGFRRSRRRGRLGARWLVFESSSRFRLLLEHDLFRKPVPTFRDHAL